MQINDKEFRMARQHEEGAMVRGSKLFADGVIMYKCKVCCVQPGEGVRSKRRVVGGRGQQGQKRAIVTEELPWKEGGVLEHKLCRQGPYVELDSAA